MQKRTTDEHRFCGPNSSLASLCVGSRSGERIPSREKRGFGSCLSVSICGCIELFRFRDRTQVETGKRTHNPFPRPGVPKWYTEGAPPQCLSPTVSPPPPLPKKRGDKVGIRWGTGGCAAQVSLFDHLAERVGRWNANGLRSFSPELDRRGKGVRSYPGKGVR